MSVRLMSQIWDMDFSPTEKLVLLALADWANDDGLAWPSIAQLAKKTGCGDRTVQRTLREAERTGLVERHEVAGKGCSYTIHPRHVVTPATAAPVPENAPTPARVAPNTSRHTRSQKASPSSRARASKADRYHRLPANWKPRPLPPNLQAKVDQWPPGMFDNEVEKLRDWAANAEDKNGKGRKLSWDSALHKWLRKADDDWQQRRQRQGGSASGFGRTIDALGDFAREIDGGQRR